MQTTLDRYAALYENREGIRASFLRLAAQYAEHPDAGTLARLTNAAHALADVDANYHKAQAALTADLTPA